MTALIRTVHMGLGPIGLSVLRLACQRPWARVVGGTRRDPTKLGQDLGTLAGTEKLGVVVAPSLAEVGPPGCCDVVVHCTGSRLEQVAPQVYEALAWGASVVSTCEELAYPWYHHPEVARQIDLKAKEARRVVLASGVNPGFAMDAIALFLSAGAQHTEGVRVRRVVDAATRRGPLQRKIGAGITPEEFESRKQEGAIGHVGLVESVAMVGAGLGWQLDRISETLDPVLASEALTTEHVSVAPSSVAGIRQVAQGYRAGAEVITLALEMYVGAKDACVTVTLVGEPSIETVLHGLHGDLCTAAVIVNVLPSLAGLAPGLRTMLDLVPLRFYEG